MNEETPAPAPVVPASPDARQVLVNALWDTGRKALLMIGKALVTYAEVYRDRNTSILADVFMAGANAIEKRIRT